MIAREWLELGRVEESPINKLTNYWRGFNNLYSTAQIRGNERDKIKGYLTSTVSHKDAQEILEIDIQALDYLLSQPVIDMRGTGLDTQQEINAFGGNTDHKAKLVELFLIIYQVRCNLEHGQKSPTSNRDVKLCRTAAPFVANVLERYL